MGVTVSASCKGQDGNTYYAGYYPYMYLTQDAAVFAGREPFGFPKKIAYIVTQEHGGKEDDGYGGFGNDYFNFTMERRGYLIHTATGRYDDAELAGEAELLRRPEVRPHEPPADHRPEPPDDEVGPHLPAVRGHQGDRRRPWAGPRPRGSTASSSSPSRSARPRPARSARWALTATPFDNLGAMMPVKELIGLMSFNFDLIIPGADTIWTQTIERTAEDIGDLLFATPYQYTMRHRFPKPPGV